MGAGADEAAGGDWGRVCRRGGAQSLPGDFRKELHEAHGARMERKQISTDGGQLIETF